VLERSLAGKHWSVEHDGFGAHGVRVVRLCLLRLTNHKWGLGFLAGCRRSRCLEDYTVEGNSN